MLYLFQYLYIGNDDILSWNEDVHVRTGADNYTDCKAATNARK